MVLLGRRTLVRLLLGLDFLLLYSVLLLKLLRLLSVALLHLLFLSFADVLLRRLLVFFFLLLLQLLVFLILLGGQFVLLLLVFLIRCRLAGARRRVFVRLNFAGMSVCWTSFIWSRRPFRSLVRSAGFLGRYRAALKVSGPGRGCDRRLALVCRGAQLWVGARLLHMLVLRRNGAGVPFLAVCFFLCRRPFINAAIAAIVAHAVSRVVFDPGVIGVVDVLVVYAVYRGVVIKMIVFQRPPSYP